MTVATAHAAAMNQASWQVSNNQTGASGVTYTYDATTTTAAIIGSVTVVLPGTPTTPPELGPVFALGAGTLATTGNMLTYTVSNPVKVASGTRLHLQVFGLTNTARQGWFTSTITTMSTGGTPTVVDDGQSTSVAFLAHNTAPDVTGLRSLSVSQVGLDTTITSPGQGYSVWARTAVQLTTEIRTRSASGAHAPDSSLRPVPVPGMPSARNTPVMQARHGTGTEADVLYLVALPGSEPSAAGPEAIGLTFVPGC